MRLDLEGSNRPRADDRERRLSGNLVVMDDQVDVRQSRARRPLLWYPKWLLACYAAALGVFILLSVASVPIGGVAFAEWWTGTWRGTAAMIATAVVFAPFFYRRLT